MRFIKIVLVSVCIFSGCKKEDNPLSPTDQQQLLMKIENDSLIYSLTIPKYNYSPGDSLNASFAIENRTNHLITFPFDSSDIYYSVFNDSSRLIMSYPKQYNGRGFFAVLPNGRSWFTITDRLHDDQNIPIHTGLYKISARVESPTTPTLTLYFTVK
jgi:hypothetical protein